MKVNSAKLKMDAGEAVFGISLNMGSPIAAELLSNCGADFLMVDNQHGSFGQESTILSLMAMNGDATPMARVAHNDYMLIGRLLDEGALGIVVPLIDTVEEARQVADACRFPPYGKRSYGWGRAGHYGADYTTWIDEQLFVAVQIESMSAVENAEAIMATPGIDGCWIGPADLALSLGFHPNDPAAIDPGERAVERVLQACNNRQSRRLCDLVLSGGCSPGGAGVPVPDGRYRRCLAGKWGCRNDESDSRRVALGFFERDHLERRA